MNLHRMRYHPVSIFLGAALLGMALFVVRHGRELPMLLQSSASIRGPVSTTTSPPELFLGFPKRTYVDASEAFSLTYPAQAVIVSGCAPLPLQVVKDGEVAYLTYKIPSNNEDPSYKDCAVISGWNGLFFAVRAVHTDQEMEQFFQDVAADPDCKGIERHALAKAPSVYDIKIKNLDRTHEEACDQLPEYRAFWNQESGAMVIAPSIEGESLLVAEPADGDAQILKSLKMSGVRVFE